MSARNRGLRILFVLTGEEYGLTETIDGAMFVHMLGEGTRNLSANKQLVNDLNVFPIPDGDTGDKGTTCITRWFFALS